MPRIDRAKRATSRIWVPDSEATVQRVRRLLAGGLGPGHELGRLVTMSLAIGLAKDVARIAVALDLSLIALYDLVLVPECCIRAHIRWHAVSTGDDHGVAVAFTVDQRVGVSPTVCESARCHVATAAVAKTGTASGRVFWEAIAWSPARVHASTVVGSGHDEHGAQSE